MNSEKKQYRYSYHLSPSEGWMNDPNGLVYYKSLYHVFYQVNPYNNRPGDIYWGHFVSNDLIHWKELPFALSPDKSYDKNGCYSGGAFVLDDKLYLIYTGHKTIENGYEETQCLAVSHDGENFYKMSSNPIISNIPKNNTHRFRDPKMYKIDDKYMLIVGGESLDNTGQVQLYEMGKNIEDWKYKGRLIKAQQGEGTMWECPDYFEISGTKFLLVSPKGLENDGINGFCSMWLEDKNLFEKEISEYVFNKVDYGQDFYAPQTFHDPIKNRQLMIAWFGMPGLQELENNSQVGALSFPREINKIDGKLYFYPIEEVTQLRTKTYRIENKQLISTVSELDISNIDSDFMLELSTEDLKAEFLIEYSNKKLQIVFKDELRSDKQMINQINIKDIRIFLDNGLTEVYINKGEYTFTNKCNLLGKLSLVTKGINNGNRYDIASDLNVIA